MPAAPCRPSSRRSTKALDTPQRPVAAIVGGAKVSTKLDLLGNLLAKVDVLIIGGAMANTFLAAQGKAVGKSLCEKRSRAGTARDIMAKAKAQSARSCCRSTPWWRRNSKRNAPSRVVDVDEVGADDMILDIGPRSVEHVVSVLARAKTLVWNGPFGAFEMEPFDNGTVEVAEAAAELTRSRQACLGRGRRRYGGGAQCRRRDRPVHLCFDRRRRLPGMAGRQGLAGRRGVAG